MNTIRSTWIGWGTLCAAGGGAYYFAKKQINADREARFQEEIHRKELQRRMEALSAGSSSSSPQQQQSDVTAQKKRKGKRNNADGDIGARQGKGLDHAGSPSEEISQDAAPVGHAPENDGQRVRERSKYEAAEPYRSRKGDRFS